MVLYLWSRIDFGFVTFIRLQINSQYNSDRNKMRLQFVIVFLCLVLTMGRSSSRKCGVDSRTLKRKVEKTSKKEVQAVIKRRVAELERSERKRKNSRDARLEAVRLKAKIR